MADQLRHLNTSALKRLALQREIEEDAEKQGHKMGVWVVAGDGDSRAECVYCGDEAIIKDGECELDDCQDRCVTRG